MINTAQKWWYGPVLCLSVTLSTGTVAAPLAGRSPVHHDISVVLSPADHAISASDTIHFGTPRSSYVFALHAGLELSVQSPGVTLKQASRDRCSIPESVASAACYEAVFNLPGDRLALKYSGGIFHPLTQQHGESRVSEVTEGVIANDGVFLDAYSRWYPVVAGELLTFALDVEISAGWDVISQGERTVHSLDSARSRIVWQALQPQDDIYLVAGRFHEYATTHGDIAVQVFLRTADAALAKQYQEVGTGYLAMYQQLIGPYPYRKFAVVENFWETGYGMPSFTLLGPRVMRFPFILHASYPHEILHNWWGNGVYVDYEKGNWSEGLTAYLADHLIREQGGGGAEYRRAALQKYVDYVAANNEFPLASFTGRHSSASEAIGYGKTMMVFHMLRQRMSDDSFRMALRRFYTDNRFRRATYDDLRRAFEATTGWRYGRFFDQWVQRTGAPEIRVNDLRVTRAGGGYRLEFELEQTQPGEHYDLHVPVAVTLDGIEPAHQARIVMEGRSIRVRYAFAERPVRVDIDPEFDLFRQLALDERPAAFSQIFGAERLLIVLPEKASAPMRRAYQALAKAWPVESGSRQEIRWDNELSALPDRSAVVVVGRENRFRDQVLRLVDATMDAQGHLDIGERRHAAEDLSVALVVTDEKRGHAPLMWLASDTDAALPGLLRKLPHYGKYSYALFNGVEPTNTDRGVWPVKASSMSVVVPYDGETGAAVSRGRLKARDPLIDGSVAP